MAGAVVVPEPDRSILVDAPLSTDLAARGSVRSGPRRTCVHRQVDSSVACLAAASFVSPACWYWLSSLAGVGRPRTARRLPRPAQRRPGDRFVRLDRRGTRALDKMSCDGQMPSAHRVTRAMARDVPRNEYVHLPTYRPYTAAKPHRCRQVRGLVDDGGTDAVRWLASDGGPRRRWLSVLGDREFRRARRFGRSLLSPGLGLDTHHGLDRVIPRGTRVVVRGRR